MNILRAKPPIYDRAEKAFGFDPKYVVFTYFPDIYVPNPDISIPPDVLVHEEVHMRQQTKNDMDPAKWWDKYIEDVQFRIEQELEAYQAQYRFCCQMVADRNEQSRMLHRLAKDFSSPMYGGCISHMEAYRRIKQL